MGKRIIVMVGLSLFIFGGLFGLKALQIRTAMQQRQPPPPPVVAAAEVRLESWRPTLHAVGSLVAVEGIVVSNEVAGVVARLHFRSGQRVDRGQALVDLDTAADEAQLEQLKAAEWLAQVKFKRAKKLLRDKMTSQSEYDEAQALLAGARAAVAAQRAMLEKKHIKAPFSGLLGIRQVSLGQYLPPGSAIVTLTALDPIHLDFSLPERDLSRLAVGQPVTVQVQPYSGTSFTGSVIAVSPAIETGSRAVQVRAELTNADGRLRPGMFTRVEVDLAEERSVATIPATAVSYNPYGEFVFVIQTTAQGPVAEHRPIETGEVRNERVEIRKGLAPGERVVAAGQIKLRSGMPVRIDTEAAPAERPSET